MKITRPWRGFFLCCTLLIIAVCGCAIVLTRITQNLLHPSINTDDGMALRVLDGHTDQIHQLGFTPNGERMVSVSSDRTARVWNVESWSIACTFRGHKDGIMSLALGQKKMLAATGDGDSCTIMWDMNACQQKASIAHPGFITQLAFDHDDNTVFIVAHHHLNSSLVCWNYRTGNHRVIPGKWEGVVSGTLPTLGQFIVTSGTDGSIVVWDKSLTRITQTLPVACRNSHKLTSVTHNGRIAVYCYSQGVVVWDIIAKKKICEYESLLINTVSSICLSPDGNYLILTGCVWAHEPGVIEIVDVSSGRLLRVLRSHQSLVCSSAISPDGRLLATGGGQDFLIKIWPLPELLPHRAIKTEK